MRILSVDQATKCGWAMSVTESGVWDFSIKKDESGGMRLIRFRAKLEEVHKLTPLDLITYERVSGFHKNALIVSAQLTSVIQVFCHDHGIEHRAFSAGEIKKWATGKGNANKEKMIASAVAKWANQINIIDDNHADALHLLSLTKNSLGL